MGWTACARSPRTTIDLALRRYQHAGHGRTEVDQPDSRRTESLKPRCRSCVITTEGAQGGSRAGDGSLGANEYLTKPIQANRVLQIAKSLLKPDA